MKRWMDGWHHSSITRRRKLRILHTQCASLTPEFRLCCYCSNSLTLCLASSVLLGLLGACGKRELDEENGFKNITWVLTQRDKEVYQLAMKKGTLGIWE